MLSYLVQNAGRVVTRNLLLEQVWGPEYVDESHLLQVNMNRLRHKLEPDPAHPRYILTKPGIGYVIAAQPDGQAVVAEEHKLPDFILFLIAVMYMFIGLVLFKQYLIPRSEPGRVFISN